MKRTRLFDSGEHPPLSYAELIMIPAYSFIIVSAVTAALFWIFKALFKREPWHPKAPKMANNNVPIYGVVDFFEQRDSMFRREARRSRTGLFSFNVGRAPVIGVTGEKGSAAMYDDHRLSLAEGQTFLFGATAKSESSDPESTVGTQAFTLWFMKELRHIIRTEAIENVLPTLINDVKSRLSPISSSSSAVIDPFDVIFKTVFVLNMRGVGCKEIADDPKWSDKTLRLINTIEDSFGANSVIFPWLPTIAKAKQMIAGTRLYLSIKSIVDARKKSGKREEDPLQYFLDSDTNFQKIFGFISSSLFAGQLNTGHNTAIGAYYLARHPKWQNAARQEIEKVAAKYSDDIDAPLVDQLSSLPFEAWESELPILDLCLRETIRLQLMGSAIRKNISDKAIVIGNEVIQPGAYVACQFNEPHFDPSIYPNPEKWEPDRYEPDRAEDKKRPHGYVGWGSGRHPCTGMRFAKYENKIVTAYLLAYFDLEACDRSGNPLPESTPLPKIQWNALAARPPAERIYIKCKVKEKSN